MVGLGSERTERHSVVLCDSLILWNSVGLWYSVEKSVVTRYFVAGNHAAAEQVVVAAE